MPVGIKGENSQGDFPGTNRCNRSLFLALQAGSERNRPIPCRSNVLVRTRDGASLTGWSAIRPVLAGFLLLADAFVVIALAVARPKGWIPPLIAFGSLLLGLVAFELWALRHRHDDE